MENNNKVFEYYEKDAHENERLIENPLEFIRTKEIISRFLPEKQIKMIDLCGASGHYSYWLAQKGHEVHLMDLSERHTIEAKNNELKYNSRLASISCGDARAVKWEDETFDMVLLMGALYHLQEKEDRLQCLKEAYRILKNGGVAIFAYISRYASMLDGFLSGFINDQSFLSIMDMDILTGRHTNPDNKEYYFTNAFFHSTEDIYNELINTKYCDIMLYAVEGFGGLINNKEYLKDNEGRKKLLHYIKITEQNMEMIGISTHYLVVCKKHI